MLLPRWCGFWSFRTYQLKPLALGTCIFLACSGLARAQSELTLQFDPVNNQGVDVTFEPAIGVATDKPSDADLKEMTDTLTLRHKYRIYADLRDIAPGKFSTFFLYDIYALDTAAQRWSKFEVKAIPRPFVDTRQTVHFTLTRIQASDEGSIDLPLHSFGGQLLSASPQGFPLKVSVSSGGALELRVQNPSPTLAVTVSKQAQLRISSSKLWDSKTSDIELNGGKDLSLGPGATSSVTFSVVPNKMHALLATLTSLKPEQAHDHLWLQITYAAEQGGVVKSTGELDIPVRFEPSLLNLFAALVIGSLLGTFASQFLPGVWQGWRTLLQQAGRALLLSVVAEIIALLLVGLGSRFVIFTFDLDPWQFLPVLVIGLLVSGGKKLLDVIGIGKGKEAGGNANAAAAAGGHDG